MDFPMIGNALRLSSLLTCLIGFAATVHAQEDDPAKLSEEARKVATALLQQIGGELKKEYEISGPLRSVIVCKYTAPEVSSTISRKSGAAVKRVSLKVRNPVLGMPDLWEQKVLLDFEKRFTRGEKPEAMEHAEIVSEAQGRYFRYMKAIPVGPLCINCHGPVDTLTEGTKAQILTEYPYDKAVGYSVGQVRGAVSYKKPL
ncbi:MAG: DUF3365 domain-containing protein [Thermomicrobiales bacterium]|jgi:hypothetical protein|nr:MAG: DUF3365 domain-containing protein [Thermomicrobiales bacterium]